MAILNRTTENKQQADVFDVQRCSK